MPSNLSKTPWLATITVLSAVFGSAGKAALPVAPVSEVDSHQYRLSADVVPSNYTLLVEPDKTAGTFSGHEEIDIELKTKQSSIIINAVDLQISQGDLQDEANQVSNLEVSTLAPSEQIKLSPKNEISPGKYRLSLKFSGVLNKHLRGLYGATAKIEDGKEVALVATQFEPTDARRMFPCFDEPAFKATFKLAALIDAGDTAISNAPTLSEKPLGAKKLITFSQTPKISTYLLALFVGPFKANDAVESDGVNVRVWSVGHPVAMGDYARDLAAKLLPFFHQYFGLAYPEQKLDLVALPDFEAGAMENLGAISFRETLLLRDDSKDSLEAKMSLASVVAHEMSHMWFGDLVTMRWWDDLWLNEAFATWMSHKAIAFAYPNWQTWEHLASAKNSSMETDALKTSRAIHSDVKNPAEAFQMFDEITYSKGASIIRMLELYAGEEHFRSGVSAYLKAHQFANASTDDLWTAIAQTSGKPINSVMHNWVYQPGFPLISVEKTDQANLRFSQARFFSNPQALASTDLWQVPIGVRSSNPDSLPAAHRSEVDYVLLSKDALSSEIRDQPSPFVNAYGAGYYRSKYSGFGVEGYADLNTLERFTLLTDQWALVRADKVSIESYLDLLAKFKDEQEPFILESVCEQFEELWDLVDIADINTPQNLRIVLNFYLSEFIRDTLRPAKQRLGWQERPTDSDTVKRARSAVLRTLGTIGQDEETIKEARNYFSDYLRSCQTKTPFALSKLLGPIESIVSYNGDAKTYAELSSVWLKLAETPSGSKRALFCLSRFRQKELIEKTLQLTLSSEVKVQDSPVLLSSIMGQKDGLEPGLAFVEENWQSIKAKYPPYMLPGIISGAKAIRTRKGLKDYRAFFQGKLPPECDQSFERTIERIENNIEFVQNFNEPINRWLKAHVRDVSTDITKLKKGNTSDAHK